MFDARFGTLLDDIFFIELHVTAIKNRVLWRADIYECCFHAGQNVLNSTKINVAVNLICVVCRSTDVMLNQAATFKHRDLREVFAYLHAHHVSP